MKMEPGISYSKKGADGKWEQPVNLKILDFTIQRGYLGAYMCPDEATLFLTMKSDDAVGREDLYISRKGADGIFSKPASLGKTINTVGFEISPFYSAKDSTLYFASNGHEGYGDADIFRTKNLDETFTKWSKPENMGPQTNTDGFDAYLAPAYDSLAFFVKEDPEVRYADIYLVKLEDPLNSKARKDSSLRAKLDKGIKKNNKKKGGDGQDEDGDPKTKYGTDKDPRSPEEIYKDLATRNRLQNKDFESILFDFGKSSLRPEGKKILAKAVKFLKANPTVGIELVGHTDSVSGDLIHLILSDKRSYAAKEYLLKNGVSRNRILSHGFGKQIYVNENDTEGGRQQNRRCELNLLMSKEEFEAYKERFKNTNVVIPPVAPKSK
jgi:outer membrane protein OmpA-like peptidoglycan-associated protein